VGASSARATVRGRRPFALLAAVAVTMIGASASAAAPAGAAPVCAHASAVPTHLSRVAADRALRCLINGVRHTHGLPSVRAERHLGRAAQRHASYMATHDFFGHVSPGGATEQTRVQRAGYLRHAHEWWLGEALAWGRGGTASPSAILRLLLASPPHRAILLDPGFRDLGVGVARGAPQGAGHGALTVTLDFGRRLT
jgi:uncharacterized protein YkwD